MQLEGIQLTTDEDQLVLGWAIPGFGAEVKAFAAELKDVAQVFALEPENALSPKHLSGQLGHEKVLKAIDIEGAIAFETGQWEVLGGLRG